MAQVLLENLTKVFDGKVTAVNDITLDIGDQEFMVIVGPSGCGKTTILRMIAGLEEPTSGTIKIGGTIVNNIPPKDRDIAMVFQNYALYPHMTAFQNMAFGLKLRKYPKAEIKKRVTEAAKLLGIEHLLYRKPRALSGGQRQRVAVGRAIVRNPRAFLFDEPLSNLDAKMRVTTRAELKSLHHKLQATTIYVTHDQSEAMTLGDRICVMHKGIIQQVALPLEVYDQPVNRFVAGFVGTPSMNFFDGWIQYKNDDIYFVMGNDGIKPSARMKDLLASYKDRKMVLGIRPEHLSLQPITGQSENGIDCMVTVVEPLGNRMDVYLKSGSDDEIVVSIEPHISIHPDEAVTIHINMDKTHIFEPNEMGRNISIAT